MHFADLGERYQMRIWLMRSASMRPPFRLLLTRPSLPPGGRGTSSVLQFRRTMRNSSNIFDRFSTKRELQEAKIVQPRFSVKFFRSYRYSLPKIMRRREIFDCNSVHQGNYSYRQRRSCGLPSVCQSENGPAKVRGHPGKKLDSIKLHRVVPIWS